MEIDRDITARKDADREALRRTAEIQALNASLEQRVQERTVHLERANKHLAAFTYSVAHDLRTPLRGISGFAEALVEEYGDRLDEKGLGYTGRIQAASGRMGTVLDDLLHLSQVSRAEMELQDADLSAEVTVICDRLRARDPGRHVRVTVEDGVRATVDLSLIRTALEMLLDNAWKFTAGREDATIEFAATQVDEAPWPATYATTGPASIPPTRTSCSSPSSGCTAPASSQAAASAWPASSASSTATAGASGPTAPSAAALPSTSPSTRRTPSCTTSRSGRPRAAPKPHSPGK
jgi:C4-dicarboxylate-specific signal transduction histidine kinase